MTKILVLSDNHGLTEEITQITERHEVTRKIHCGDSELTSDSKELNDFLTVAGNCDRDFQFPDEKTFAVGDLTCFITHGHLYRVKESLLTLSYRAQEVNAQIIFYGHTHVANVEKINNQLFINPGSLRMPRGRRDKTYAILEWNQEKIKLRINFYTIDGDLLHDMVYETFIDV